MKQFLKVELYAVIQNMIEDFLEPGGNVSGVDQFEGEDEVEIDHKGVKIKINVKEFKSKLNGKTSTKRTVNSNR
jgi:hypothetical protein